MHFLLSNDEDNDEDGDDDKKPDLGECDDDDVGASESGSWGTSSILLMLILNKVEY